MKLITELARLRMLRWVVTEFFTPSDTELKNTL